MGTMSIRRKSDLLNKKRPPHDGGGDGLGRKLRRLNQNLSSVHETSRLLTGPMELQQVLEIVVKTVAQAVGADAAGLRLLDEDNGQLVLKATYGLSEEYRNKGPVTAGESVLNKRALKGQAIVVEDMRADPHFKKYHKEIMREGLISNLSLGLMYHGKGIGIMRLYNKHPRHYGQAEISLAQTVAQQSAAAIINARLYAEALEGERMARQVKLAGQVQRHLIPERPPILPGLDLAGIYVPCYDVGGDFYDFIKVSDGRLVLAIGDVMGKGVPASLTMASLRSSLRAYAEEIDRMDDLVSRVNRMFCNDIAWGEFATLFCASLSADRCKLTYCNCGHNPAMLVHDQRITELMEGGIVLGVDKRERYEASEIEMQPHDMLIMYTDGLAEAFNYQRESFGRQRIAQAALASVPMTAEQAAKNILWLMRKFTGLTKYLDDTAVVVLKRTEIPPLP
jgi:phosphoserine phosphatase RsbU/P